MLVVSLIVLSISQVCCFFFFFNDTATTEIYTLSLHDALPISSSPSCELPVAQRGTSAVLVPARRAPRARSEEHTSELQSQSNLVCRLLLEKKKILSLKNEQSTILI